MPSTLHTECQAILLQENTDQHEGVEGRATKVTGEKKRGRCEVLARM